MRELWGWYTTGQAAHHAGMSRQTVVDLAREGKVRAVYVGGEHDHGRGTWIYDPASVGDYTEKRRERMSWDDVAAASGGEE